MNQNEEVENIQQQVLTLMQQGQLEAAQRKVASLPAERPLRHYLQAGLEGARGRFAEAEQACRRALALDDGDPMVWFRLANSVDAHRALK